MFFQPSNTEPANPNNRVKSAGALKSARRKRRKLELKYKNKSKFLKKERQRFANSMSSWAENFAILSTWRLKHQCAIAKARCKALEYENSILLNTLRDFYVKGKCPHNIEYILSGGLERTENEGFSNEESLEEEEEQDEAEEEEEEAEQQQEDEDDQEDGEETLEVNEEFQEFLRKNAEFRQERDERKRLQKLDEMMPMTLLESCPAGLVDPKAEYEELYGANWQRIAALEMAMESQFISDSDKYKPVYWPVIPLKL